jgi:hypothetical protein
MFLPSLHGPHVQQATYSPQDYARLCNHHPAFQGLSEKTENIGGDPDERSAHRVTDILGDNPIHVFRMPKIMQPQQQCPVALKDLP